MEKRNGCFWKRSCFQKAARSVRRQRRENGTIWFFWKSGQKNGGGTEAGRRIRQRWKASETRIVYMLSEMVKQEKLRQNEPADLLSKPLQADQIAAVLDRIRMEDQRSGRFLFLTEKANFFIRSHIQRFCSFRAQGEKSRYIRNREFMNTMENCQKY